MLGLGLRLRVFLFFAFLALGSAVVILAAGYAGFLRSAEHGTAAGQILTVVLALLCVTGLVTGVWLLFDDHVARPIETLSAALRARAHGGVRTGIDAGLARYLGDLAPAADAVSQALSETTSEQTRRLQDQTADLRAQSDRLAEILSGIPTATVLLDSTGHILLYDQQAAQHLSQHGAPRLGAPINDYFGPTLTKTLRQVRASGYATPIVLDNQLEGRLTPLSDGSVLLTLPAVALDHDHHAPRPLVWDFDLTPAHPASGLLNTALDRLIWLVFDTETTGLLPHRDDIVQIGALRIVNLRPLPGEELDTFVNPGRPIPARATEVHRITDAMVSDAPPLGEAAHALHMLARDAVIVAHNAPFDMAFLHRHAQQSGLAWDHPVVDTVLVSAILFGTSVPHTLDAICDRLDITIPPQDRHSAMGDARATATALIRMVPMLKARGIVTLADLLDQTRRHGRLLKDLN